MSDKWYPGKALGLKKKEKSSKSEKSESSDKWYPGKFLGKAPDPPAGAKGAKSVDSSSGHNYSTVSRAYSAAMDEENFDDPHVMSVRRGRIPSLPIGTVNLRLHGGKFIEATRPCVKMQLKEQSEVYCGNDYTLETSFIFDCPTADIVVTVYDKYAVNIRSSEKGTRNADDNNGAIVGHILIPLVQFLTLKGVAQPTPQWYELLPVSKSLQTTGHYRAAHPIVRTRIVPLGFLCVSVDVTLNANIPNVFMLYFQGAEHEDPLAPNLWVEQSDGSDSSATASGSGGGRGRQKSVDGESAGDTGVLPAGYNLLYANGPVDLLLDNLVKIHEYQNVLPFELSEIGPAPIAILIAVYSFACMSIRAWEIPLYLFLFVAVLGGCSSLLKPRPKVKLWSEYARDTAAAAAQACASGGSVYRCPPRIDDVEQSAYLQVGAASRRDIMRRDFIRVVERFDLLVTNIEKFFNLWNFVDARVSVVAYAVLLLICLVSSIMIGRLGVAGYLWVSGSVGLITFYLLVNADLTGRIDDLCEEEEERIRESLAENSDNKRLKLKEKIIQAWKVLRILHHCIIVFWSRVPTRFELEHRAMAALCRVVEEGREMMDASQHAASMELAVDSADKKTQ